MGFITNSKLRAGAHILYEAERISRENVTIASGNNVTVATVVGKITASGKYAPVDATATDGTEDALAVVFHDTDASAADEPGVVNDTHSVVRETMLVWPAGATDPQIAAWTVQLRAAGIKTR